MREIFIAAVMLLQVQAYDINGEPALLVSCEWEQVGTQVGYVGSYEAIDGGIWKVWFGRDFCEY